MKPNVSKFDYCFGCGVCAVACKHKAITMQYDKEGFYHPAVDQSACVDCGICLDVCSFNHDDVMKPKEQELGSYAAWSKDRDTRIYCTSGGLSYEFGKKCIGDGYQFCGVRYNVEKKRSEHYLATTVEELAASKQSKYIQSWSAVQARTEIFGDRCTLSDRFFAPVFTEVQDGRRLHLA